MAQSQVLNFADNFKANIRESERSLPMPWSPVTKETFERILKEEIAALTPETARAYEKHAITPYEQRCLRSADSGIERIFVVARNGSKFVFFDDVE